MADSLQDQLKALGLAKNKPAGKKRKPPRKPTATPRRQSAKVNDTGEMDLGKAYALRMREEKSSAEQARKNKQAEDRKRREINRAIREIVKDKRLNKADAEVPRHFMFKGRIRKLYVTAEQNQAITANELGLVYLTGGYHLLPADSIEQVRNIAADHVIELEGDESEEDEFPVPDDIAW